METTLDVLTLEGGPDMGGGGGGPAPPGTGPEILQVPQSGTVTTPEGGTPTSPVTGNSNLIWWVLGGLVLLALLSEPESGND
jgi:hypothetical protein